MQNIDKPLTILSICDHLILLHLCVKLALQRTHPDLDHLLDLVRQLTLHIFLQPPQQERSEHLVQTTDNKEGLFFVQLNLITGTRVGEGRIEPFIERFDGVKDLGKNKIEEGPEFGEVVLKGRITQDEAVARVIEVVRV